MENNEIFDNLEKLHQELKYDYLKWAKNKPNGGLGSVNNSLTLEFLRKNMDKNKINKIKHSIKLLTDKRYDSKTKYLFLRELYLIHPSFHEIWFLSAHYNHLEIVKGRLGLKAYLTCQPDNEKTQKGITTFLLKRAILLENLYSSKLSKTLIEYKTTENLDQTIKLFLDQYNNNLGPFEVLELLPSFFQIVNTLLKKCEYSSINSVLNYNSWMLYAPCSINEGPIFHKTSGKSRIEIFKEIKSINENTIRNHLKNHFTIKEIVHNLNSF